MKTESLSKVIKMIKYQLKTNDTITLDNLHAKITLLVLEEYKKEHGDFSMISDEECDKYIKRLQKKLKA